MYILIQSSNIHRHLFFCLHTLQRFDCNKLLNVYSICKSLLLTWITFLLRLGLQALSKQEFYISYESVQAYGHFRVCLQAHQMLFVNLFSLLPRRKSHYFLLQWFFLHYVSILYHREIWLYRVVFLLIQTLSFFVILKVF